MSNFKNKVIPFGAVPDEAEFLARCAQYRPHDDAQALYSEMCEAYANSEAWAGSSDAFREQGKVGLIVGSIGLEWQNPLI